MLMGALLDGIPEAFILGIAIAAGGGLSLPFFMAVVVSNLPEGMASATALKEDPRYTAGRILRMWGLVMCVSAGVAGFGGFVGTLRTMTGATAQAFAAGALLTMLIDDLIPEARERGGLGAGLAAVFGFAVAFALHKLSA